MNEDWGSKDSNPMQDLKNTQETLNEGVHPHCAIDFSTIDVRTDKNHVDEQGKPRKDVLIYQDRLLCHPNMEDRLKQGLTLFFGNKRWTTQESPPP